MATTYTWDCTTVDVYPTNQEETDVVYNVHWRVTGTSDTLDADDVAYTSTSIGTQALDTTDLTDFSAFADLTNASVTAWVKEAMGADQVTELEAGINAAIAALITPASVTKTIAS